MTPLFGSPLEDIYGDSLQNQKQPESFKKNETDVNKETEHQTRLKYKISKYEDQENTTIENSIKKYMKKNIVDLVGSLTSPSIMNTIKDKSTQLLGTKEKFRSNEIDINLIGEIIREVILLLKFIVILLLLLLINQISKR